MILFAASPGTARQAPGVPTAPASPAAQLPPTATAAPGLTPAWTVTLAEPASGPLSSDGSRAYVPLRSGHVLALSADSGERLWQIDTGPSPMITGGGGLLFVAAGPVIEARDGATGAAIWRHTFDSGSILPPTWNGGWLFAATDRGEAAMLRAADGQRLWTRAMGAAPGAAVAMTGDRVYLSLVDGRVLALRLGSGDPLWERRLGGAGTGLLALDDRLFVGADDRFFYCLSASDGKVKWRWRTGGTLVGTPVVEGDLVFFLSLDNVLRALDRGNGHQRWKRALSFRPAAGPFSIDGLLAVSGLSAPVALFRAATGEPAGQIQAAGETAVPPLVLPAPAGPPPATSFIVASGEGVVQRLDPAPPVLPSHPVPGLPLFLEGRG